MWTLFLIQTNDTIHLWQSSNWIFLTTPFTSLYSTSLCHQLTLQPRTASSGILDLSFPPLRFHNYTTHLQSTPPPASFQGEMVDCLQLDAIWKKQAAHIYESFRGPLEERNNCHPGPFSWQHLKGCQVRTAAPSCPERKERVKFEPWIASLSSLCIICQSWIKGVFCPPAASPGVHISLDLATFLWNTSRKSNDFTFLWKVAFLYPPAPYFYLISIFNQILQTRQVIWERIFKFLLSNFLRIAS